MTFTINQVILMVLLASCRFVNPTVKPQQSKPTGSGTTSLPLADDHSELTLEVAGNKDDVVAVSKGIPVNLSWTSKNLNDCVLDLGGKTQKIEAIGKQEHSFTQDEKVSVTCKDSQQKNLTSTIQVNSKDYLQGDIHSKVSGYYENPQWGEMFVSIKNNQFVAAYNYDMGSVKGQYNPDTGIVQAWWCEMKEGVRAYTELGEGPVHFVFRESENGILMDGRWTHRNKKSWRDDWDLNLVKQTQPEQLEIKKKLENQLAQSNIFCTP